MYPDNTKQKAHTQKTKTKKSWSLFCVGQLPLCMAPELKCGWYIQWQFIGENWFFPFPNRHQLQIAPRLEVGLCIHFPSCTLGFYLVWICTVLVYAVTVYMSSYIYQSGCTWIKLFPWSHPPLPALIICFLFCIYS